MKSCFKTTIAGFPIELKQQSKHKFTVIYGSQVTKDLVYDEAANELGYAIMHGLACEGKFDNEEAR